MGSIDQKFVDIKEGLESWSPIQLSHKDLKREPIKGKLPETEIMGISSLIHY